MVWMERLMKSDWACSDVQEFSHLQRLCEGMDLGVHVVVFPLPAMGHITPMVHLATSLVSQGVSVTFVTTDTTHARVLSTIKETTTTESPPSFEFVSIPDDGKLGKDGGGPQAMMEVITLLMSLQGEFERLLEAIVDMKNPQGLKVCLISDFLVEWAGASAAKLGVPRVAFWSSSATFLLCMYHAKELLAAGCIPLTDGTAEALIPELEGLPTMLRARELPFALHMDYSMDPGFEARTACMISNLDSPCVMINTFDELEHEAIQAVRKLTRNLLTIGPLLPPTQRAPTMNNREPVLEWLDKKTKDSVLYVSFGTVAGLESMRHLEELAGGIEASGLPFVWVFRSNLVEEESEELIKTFRERTSERGLVVSWAPQLQVLQHEAVGGFLSHCGWNSVMESLMSGVPLLGWPCMAEQNLNLKFIQDVWRVGYGLKSIQREKIADALVKLIRGVEVREARERIDSLRNAGREAKKCTQTWFNW